MKSSGIGLRVATVLLVTAVICGTPRRLLAAEQKAVKSDDKKTEEPRRAAPADRPQREAQENRQHQVQHIERRPERQPERQTERQPERQPVMRHPGGNQDAGHTNAGQPDVRRNPGQVEMRRNPVQQPEVHRNPGQVERRRNQVEVEAPHRERPEVPEIPGVQGRSPVYHPAPNMQGRANPDGSYSHVDVRTHTTVRTDRGGRVTVIERPGLTATHFRPSGRPAHIERVRVDGSRLVVNRGFHGERRVEVVRRDGVRVVTGWHPYVERPYHRGYVARTYVYRGRTVVRVYRPYTYGRVHYVTYVPRVYYQPVFYGWMFRPWGPRVMFSWGWGRSAPWFYDGYFAPEPYYPAPAYWLTDYLLAENLRLAYENRQLREARQEPYAEPEAVESSGAPLTPEIKALIAEEVKRQLAEEQAAAAQPGSDVQISGGEVPPPALKQRVFIVNSSMEIDSVDGTASCALSPGDIIERTPGRQLTDDGRVEISVMSSKPGNCQADFAGQIDLATLQEMQNQFREQLSSGVESLANNQGRSGLPMGPGANPRSNPDANADSDPEARNLIDNLNHEADETEADVQQEAEGQ